jgi:predicted RNase H-like HicB family nuclease
MLKNFTLEYWLDDGWYVGKIKEIPGIFSQGETIEELEDNIRDAYSLIMADERIDPNTEVKTKDVEIEIS